jgi:hypothetical protein
MVPGASTVIVPCSSQASWLWESSFMTLTTKVLSSGGEKLPPNTPTSPPNF